MCYPGAANYKRLNTLFVPATVETQINAGLDVYILTVPDEPPGIPD